MPNIGFQNNQLVVEEYGTSLTLTGAVTIDWSNGPTQTGQITGNITSTTFSNAVTGATLLLRIQHNANQYTWTFGSNTYHIDVTGSGGKTYTLLAGATMYTWFSIYCSNATSGIYWITELPFHA